MCLHTRSTFQNRFFALIAMVLGVLAPLLAFEVALRIGPPTWLEQRMQELTIGRPYRYNSDQDWPVIRDNGIFRQFKSYSEFVVRHYEYEHRVRIDDRGGRITPYPAEAVKIVPFLGDSFTFGTGVEDGETFLSRMAAASSYRFLNLGVPGSALHNQLDIVDMRHDELGQPKHYVFIVFMGNDLTDIRKKYEPQPSNATLRDRRQAYGWLRRINDVVYHHGVLKRLYVIQFVRQRLLAVFNRSNANLMLPIYLNFQTNTNYLDNSLIYFEKELQRLQDMATKRGFEYAFIVIPDVHQVNLKRYTEKARYYDLDHRNLSVEQVTNAIAALLKQFRIPYLDLGPCLSQAPLDGLYYIQDNHLTPAGHARAARCMLENEVLSELF